MKQITINSNNEPYYSEDFIKGFNCGAQRQFEADISDADRPQKWIPCSERMPDLEEYVLVTLRYGERMIMALDWDDGKIEWKTQEESIIYDNEEVVAWQPLPKPWKGADNECR